MLTRLAVLISGSGTNLQAILDAIAAKHLTAKVVLVVSNRKAAYGLTRAESAGIPTLYFPLQAYAESGRDGYDAALADKISACQPDLIILAGWMHVLSPIFLDRFPKSVINLHPALPGTFPGINAIQRAYNAAQQGSITHSGCMVHYVVPEIDAGAVIAQSSVPIAPDDTLETFEANMHAAEHGLIVEAIQKLIDNKIGVLS